MAKKKEKLFVKGPFIHIDFQEALEAFYKKYPDLKEKELSKNISAGAVSPDTQVSLRFSLFKEMPYEGASKEEEDAATIRNMFRAFLKGLNFVIEGEHYVYLDL